MIRRAPSLLLQPHHSLRRLAALETGITGIRGCGTHPSFYRRSLTWDTYPRQEGYLRWIERLISEHGSGSLQIMYGLRGEKDLPEEELVHLDGYKGSWPVRIGNGAARQRQLDIYGEIMDASLKLSDYVGKIDVNIWPFLQDICDYVVISIV